MSLESVIVHACEDVNDFFEKLSWRGSLLKGTPPEQWLFRGHAKDDYRLEPTALRQGSALLLEYVPRMGEPATNFEQVLGEASALDIFVHRADEAGLSLPEDSQQMRAELAVFNGIKGLNQVWPKMAAKFDQWIGGTNTARNWKTVLKLAELGRAAEVLAS